MKIGFAGTGTFAQLIWRQLADSECRPELLVTAPAARRGRHRQLSLSPLADLAKEAGVPVLAPASWDASAVKALQGAQLGCLVVADYGRKLPADQIPCAINVHPSLLPRWRGAAPVQRTLWEGDRYTGISIIGLVDAIDAGPIYAQCATAVFASEDSGQLMTRLAELAAPLLQTVLAEIASGSAKPVDQDTRGVRWAKRLAAAEEWLELDQLTAVSVIRRVRALAPRPGAKVTLTGRTVQLLAAEPSPLPLAPGAVGTRDGQLVIGTRDGSVRVARLRPASGREMSGADFLRGLSGGGR
ncbi:MAG: methionyl-tRNA formyltransferase [Sulfobacillus sp.]